MHHKDKKVLFVLKNRENSWGCYSYGENGHLSSGLWNSARMVSDMINRFDGATSKLVHVKDANEIDAKIHDFATEGGTQKWSLVDFVIIEAFFVPPKSLKLLVEKYPKTKFVIRNHSEIPFLCSESMSFEWFFDYVRLPNVIFASNSPRAHRELMSLARIAHPHWTDKKLRKIFILLSNYYPVHEIAPHHGPSHCENQEKIRIGVFSSFRPLKNITLMATAAILFADSIERDLQFVVCGGRQEFHGESILKTLRDIFANLGRHTKHELIEVGWLDLQDFLKVSKSCDLQMMVSLSETFSIVGANAVEMDCPILLNSSEVPWADPEYCANPTDSSDMVSGLAKLWRKKQSNPKTFHPHLKSLKAYSHKSRERWKEFILGENEGHEEENCD